MKQNLESVSETLLVPLWARATETKHSNPIIKDEKAIEMMEEIDYDFSKFDDEWLNQVVIAIRTEILDNATKAFIDKYPNAIIINLGCGLDTRFFRLNNGKICWYDLDLPEAIDIRKQFFEQTDRYKMIAKSVFDYSWVNEIIRINEPVLIIAEGLLMYFTELEVKGLMNKLVDAFPGAEMLFEMATPTIVNSSHKHETFSEMGAIFQWGIKSGKEVEKLNPLIKFIKEWKYMDYHKSRWRQMRWLALIPAFKNRFSNQIVHLKFC